MDTVRIVIRERIRSTPYLDDPVPNSTYSRQYEIPKIVFNYITKDTELKILKELSSKLLDISENGDMGSVNKLGYETSKRIRELERIEDWKNE